MLRHGNWSITLRLEGIQKGKKIIKSKKLQLQGKIGEHRITLLEKSRMRGDLIETFKIMEFLIMVGIFLIILIEVEIYRQGRCKKKKIVKVLVYNHFETTFCFNFHDTFTSNYRNAIFFLH